MRSRHTDSSRLVKPSSMIAVASNKATSSQFRPHIFATAAPEQMQKYLVWYAPLQGVDRSFGLIAHRPAIASPLGRPAPGPLSGVHRPCTCTAVDMLGRSESDPLQTNAM